MIFGGSGIKGEPYPHTVRWLDRLRQQVSRASVFRKKEGIV